MKLNFKSKARALTTAAALGFALVVGASMPANAITVDFTAAGWIGANSITQDIAGVGNVTVSANNGGILNADNLTNPGSVPCSSNPGLACVKDGIGIGDDEVTFASTIGSGEILNVRFENVVDILALGFLDLFTLTSEETETASFGSNSITSTPGGSADGTASGPGNGFILVDQLITGVTSINFLVRDTSNANSDFALAFLEVRASNETPPPVPLPAALPLYGTGLAIMGFIGWRRKQRKAAA